MKKSISGQQEAPTPKGEGFDAGRVRSALANERLAVVVRQAAELVAARLAVAAVPAALDVARGASPNLLSFDFIQRAPCHAVAVEDDLTGVVARCRPNATKLDDRELDEVLLGVVMLTEPAADGLPVLDDLHPEHLLCHDCPPSCATSNCWLCHCTRPVGVNASPAIRAPARCPSLDIAARAPGMMRVELRVIGMPNR